MRWMISQAIRSLSKFTITRNGFILTSFPAFGDGDKELYDFFEGRIENIDSLIDLAGPVGDESEIESFIETTRAVSLIPSRAC